MDYREDQNNQRKVCRAMELLVLAAYEATSNLADPAMVQMLERSPTAYLNEYCTVRVAAPRMAGHTQAIVQLMDSHEREGIVCHAVTPVAAAAERWRLQLQPRVPIMSMASLLRVKTLPTILFVDNASFLGAGNTRAVERFALECLKHNGQQGRFILVYVQ